jgi:SAM-dependent methyltransferase
MKLSGALIDGYNVVACRACGFCFASELPSQAELDAYYQNQSKYEHDTRRSGPSEYDTRRLPLAVGIIADWVPDKSARILDIGCANGGLLAELRKNGYENVFGADPSPVCASTARDLYDIEVTTASLFEIPSKLGVFDFVILGSVLEHILDLGGAAQKIRSLLKPGGSVYIEVPDMTRCSLLNDAPFQEFSVEHINFFGPISLQNLWQKHGFVTAAFKQTDIEQVPGLTVYEIKALFSLDDRPAGRVPFDSDTKDELLRYIQRAQEKLHKLEQTIDSLAASREPVIVWGVGTHTQSLLATTRLKDVNIRAFVDSNVRYVGQQLHGVPVLSADELKGMNERILVSSQQFQGEIVQLIQQSLELPNKVITLYTATGPNNGILSSKNTGPMTA